jgi:hypothetical protein
VPKTDAQIAAIKPNIVVRLLLSFISNKFCMF